MADANKTDRALIVDQYDEIKRLRAEMEALRDKARRFKGWRVRDSFDGPCAVGDEDEDRGDCVAWSSARYQLKPKPYALHRARKILRLVRGLCPRSVIVRVYRARKVRP